jgi:hypothetical protein
MEEVFACSQDRLSAVGLHFPLLVESCVAVESGSLVEPVFAFCGVFGSLSVPSCVDLALLYDTVVQLSFNSGWEEYIL